MNEFWNQGDEEASKEMPVTDGYNRSTCSIPDMQVAFITYVVLPFWEAFSVLIPGEFSDEILEQININRDFFEAKKIGNKSQPQTAVVKGLGKRRSSNLTQVLEQAAKDESIEESEAV